MSEYLSAKELHDVTDYARSAQQVAWSVMACPWGYWDWWSSRASAACSGKLLP